MLHYEETPPPESLRPFVHSLWAFTVPDDWPASQHHIPPDGCVSLAAVPGPRTVFVGPMLAGIAVPIHPGTTFRGLRLRPEAARLVHAEPRAWVGRMAPLDLVDGALSADGETVDRLFTSLLDRVAKRAATAPAPDGLVAQAALAIDEADGDLRIRDLARTVGVSIRTLQRRFLAATGLTPKQYARVRRFRRALSNMLADEPDDWGRVAADLGFADQAHFIREVVALTGESPTAVEARLGRIDHRGVTP